MIEKTQNQTKSQNVAKLLFFYIITLFSFLIEFILNFEVAEFFGRPANNNSRQVYASQLQRQGSLNQAKRPEMSLHDVERELEAHLIFKSKKMQKYRCDLCNYFCNTVDVVMKHIEGEIHKNNHDVKIIKFVNINSIIFFLTNFTIFVKALMLEMSIRELEMPDANKLTHLSSFLTNFYTANVMPSETLKHNYDIYHKFKGKFLEKHPDATVNIYGSVVYGICFKDTPCDISVEFNKYNRTSEQVLNEVSEFIRTEMSEEFEVEAANGKLTKSSPKLPGKKSKAAGNSANLTKLTFETKGQVKAQFNFTSGVMADSYKTSLLLRAYMELDERAKILAFCFRYMAKVKELIHIFVQS
jgi:hypothetical protein